MWKFHKTGIVLVVGLGSCQVTATEGLPKQPTAEIRPFTSSAQDLLNRTKGVPTEREISSGLFKVLDEIPSDQLPRIARELQVIHELESSRSPLLQVVVARWGTEDPKSAQGWVQGLPRRTQTYGLIQRSLVHGMAKTDPEAALRYARALPVHSSTYLITTIARTVSDSDPAAAFSILQSVPGGYVVGDSSSIFDGWAQRNPAAAVGKISELLPDQRVFVTGSVFEIWGKKDHSAALAAAAQIKSSQERNAASSRALSAWGHRDPSAAAEWFASRPPAEQANMDPRYLVAAITAKDPQAALSLFAKLNGRARANAVSGIASKWAETDLQAAWTWALSLTVPPEKSDAIDCLCRALRNATAAELLACSKRITKSADKILFLQSCVSHFSILDQDKFILVFDELEPAVLQTLLRNPELRPKLAKAAPSLFMKLIQKVNEDQIRLPLEVSLVAEGFAAQDLTAAYAWARKLPEEIQSEGMAPILRSLARSNAPDAFQKALAVKRWHPQHNVMAEILSQWALADPAGLEKAALQMADEPRTLAQQEIMKLKIAGDPKSAADHLLQLLKSERKEDTQAALEVAATLAGEWAAINPNEAAGWLLQLPPGEAKDHFATGLANGRFAPDVDSTDACLKHLPAGPTKDLLLSSFANRLEYPDLAVAFDWARQIQAPAKRDEVYGQALRLLLWRDDAAGRKAVEEAAISAEAKQQLLSNPFGF